METTIRQFQEEVRDILNQDTWFGDHGIDWLAEDTLDIEYEIKKHLGQTGIVAVVTTPELTYQGECKSVAEPANYEKSQGDGVTAWTTKDQKGRKFQILTRHIEGLLYWLVSAPWVHEPFLHAEPNQTITVGSDGIFYTVTLTMGENGEPTFASISNETDSSEVTLHDAVYAVNKGFDATISLQIVENPTVNRGKPDKDAIATALDVGHRAVYTLSGYDTEHYNDFNPSTIKQSTVAGAGGKLLQVDCRFTSTPVL